MHAALLGAWANPGHTTHPMCPDLEPPGPLHTSSLVLAHWGKCNHPELPCLMGEGQRKVHCSAQNSLLALETPTCLCSAQVPHLRVYLERLLRQLSCAPPCTPHPQSPGPPELANMATRVTCLITWHHSARPHLSFISQIDIEIFRLWAPAGRRGYVPITRRVSLSPGIH